MSIKVLLLTLLAAGNITLFAQKKEKDKVLANKTYTVEFIENDAKKPATYNDEITFRSEKVNTKVFARENQFTATDYTASVDSSSNPISASFVSEGKNQNEEIMKWEGTITGEEIEGSVIVTSKKGKTIHTYSFSGTLKAKPGKK